MRIIENLHNDGRSISAVVEVGAKETADIDRMLALIDGEEGEYSVDVKLVATDYPPEIELIAGHRLPRRQSSFERPAEIWKQRRYYEVQINHVQH